MKKALLIIIVFMAIKSGSKVYGQSEDYYLGNWQCTDTTSIFMGLEFIPDSTGTFLRGESSFDFQYQIENQGQGALMMSLTFTEGAPIYLKVNRNGQDTSIQVKFYNRREDKDGDKGDVVQFSKIN